MPNIVNVFMIRRKPRATRQHCVASKSSKRSIARGRNEENLSWRFTGTLMRIVAVSEVQPQDQTVVFLIEQGLYVVTIATLAVSVLVRGTVGRPPNVYKKGLNNIKNFTNHIYTPRILTLPWL